MIVPLPDSNWRSTDSYAILGTATENTNERPATVGSTVLGIIKCWALYGSRIRRLVCLASTPGWRNWQTQRTQNPPGFGPWGFDSPSRHQHSLFCENSHLDLLDV